MCLPKCSLNVYQTCDAGLPKHKTDCVSSLINIEYSQLCANRTVIISHLSVRVAVRAVGCGGRSLCNEMSADAVRGSPILEHGDVVLNGGLWRVAIGFVRVVHRVRAKAAVIRAKGAEAGLRLCSGLAARGLSVLCCFLLRVTCCNPIKMHRPGGASPAPTRDPIRLRTCTGVAPTK